MHKFCSFCSFFRYKESYVALKEYILENQTEKENNEVTKELLLTSSLRDQFIVHMVCNSFHRTTVIRSIFPKLSLIRLVRFFIIVLFAAW
jgi:hypothetical protein